MNPFKKILKKIIGRKNIFDILLENGLVCGDNFFMNRGCLIDFSHCWLIKIGNDVTLAPNVTILAHDASTTKHLGYTKIAKVTIGNNVFIGAGSLILPGVKIGDNVIIGAGSIVTKDVPSDSVALGSPSKVISKTKEYVESNKNKIHKENTFSDEYTLKGRINEEKKIEMLRKIDKYGMCFVE